MKKLQKYKDAKDDLEEGNEALGAFRRAHEEVEDHEHEKRTIHQFYQPSEEMKVYKNMVSGGLGVGSGWLVSRFV